MKIGFIVTSHWSERIRPQGDELLRRYIDSILKHCTYDYNIYIVDNQSEFKLPAYSEENIKYTRIDNQYEKGLTGAWNVGLHNAYSDSCDVLINCNDDLWFSESINNFIKHIISDNNISRVYSTLTNGVLSGPHKSSGPREGTQVLACTTGNNVINGFLFAITKEHYEKYRHNDQEYFPLKHLNDGGDGKWGGQEGYWIELSAKGLSGLIFNDVFVEHTKFRAWKTAKNIDNEK